MKELSALIVVFGEFVRRKCFAILDQACQVLARELPRYHTPQRTFGSDFDLVLLVLVLKSADGGLFFGKKDGSESR